MEADRAMIGRGNLGVHARHSNFRLTANVSKTRGHAYKLFKSHSNNSTRYRFFAERVVSVWNSLPASVNFSTLGSFKRSIKPTDVDFINFLKYA